MYCDLCSQYIQVRKLFKGGNYSRAETIRGNTVCKAEADLFINGTELEFHEILKRFLNDFDSLEGADSSDIIEEIHK